jgi:hypothetical protein
MEDKGVMYGLTASYLRRVDSHVPIKMIKAEVQASWGLVDYTSVTTGYINGTPDSMIESRVLIGSNLFSVDPTMINYYVGLGYRRLTDKSEGMVSTSGFYGYDRESNYYYLPIGIELSSSFDNSWMIGGLLEYDLFIDGTQITSIPKDMKIYGVSASKQFTNDQKDGYGLRVSLQMMKRINNAYCLLFEPYCRYWHIKASKPDSITIIDSNINQRTISVVEPANTSTEYGIKAGLIF